MELPGFPRFADVDLSLKPVIKGIFGRHPLEASEYTYTNLFAFTSTYDFRVSVLNENLVILRNAEPASMFCPAGGSDMLHTLDKMFDHLRESGHRPCLERVPESFVKMYLNGNNRYIVREERDHFDYIYDARELIELKGRKFHDKKNKANKFRNSHTYEYQTLTAGLIEECLEFEKYWCEVRDCEKYYGLNKERCAVHAMLKNFAALDITGGIIRVDGKIAALSLGEQLLPDTFVVHVEKANPDIPGLYQIINQEFLMHEAADFRFVNREQDLGVEGLRKAKMSYNPSGFIKKYRVEEKAG